MLKLSFGNTMSEYTSEKNRKSGRMLYKTGMDMTKSAYNAILTNGKKINQNTECESKLDHNKN